MMKAILRIPGDRSSALIEAIDGSQVYFEGGEEQALRMSFCLPPFMGGNMYTVSEGDLFEREYATCFKIEDGAGLGNHVEIEFRGNLVLRTSVFWS